MNLQFERAIVGLNDQKPTQTKTIRQEFCSEIKRVEASLNSFTLNYAPNHSNHNHENEKHVASVQIGEPIILKDNRTVECDIKVSTPEGAIVDRRSVTVLFIAQ